MKNLHRSPRAEATRQKLIEAAGAQLLEKGYAGATTRSIAKAAGVNELTLFRYFPTKKELFSELFKTYAPLTGIQTALAGALTGDPRQDLIAISNQFTSVMLERRKAILLTLSETGELEELRQVISELPRRGRQMLAFYLQMQMDQGRLKRVDPQMAAQALIGMFMAYIISQSLLDEPIVDVPSLVPFFVDLFLDGMSSPPPTQP